MRVHYDDLKGAIRVAGITEDTMDGAVWNVTTYTDSAGNTAEIHSPVHLHRNYPLSRACWACEDGVYHSEFRHASNLGLHS